MTDTSFDKELSYFAARLREKSTYAGLTVIISLVLPIVTQYVPALAHTDAASIVNDISMIGIGVGSLFAIFMPEKQ